MHLSEYQQQAGVTDLYPSSLNTVTDPVLKKTALLTAYSLGLASESGEVASVVKKRLRGDVDHVSDELLANELGDVLWYLSRMATALGLSLEEIAEMNIKKLRDRQSRGTLKGSGSER